MAGHTEGSGEVLNMSNQVNKQLSSDSYFLATPCLDIWCINVDYQVVGWELRQHVGGHVDIFSPTSRLDSQLFDLYDNAITTSLRRHEI
jgi:hypothetical protein